MSFSTHLGYNSLLSYIGEEGVGGRGGGMMFMGHCPISKVTIFMDALLIISTF